MAPTVLDRQPSGVLPEGSASSSPCRPAWPVRLAWLPVPLLLSAIIVARVAGWQEVYQFDTLRLILSFIFYTLVSLGTLFLIGRSFLASGAPGLLLLECGVLLWSLAGTVGDAVFRGDENVDVTIFNVTILLAGVCHLTGAVVSLRPQRAFRRKRTWLVTACALTLGALWVITRATLAGWLPVFFVQGQGGTAPRYVVLVSAITLFVLSARLLHAGQRGVRLPFTTWYALAMLLLAVGLFGIMIQLSLGSVVNWLSRAAQWLGGGYLLLAAFAALRGSSLPLLPQQPRLPTPWYRYALAVAVTLAAAAVRLAFLQSIGTRAPFLTFYPAVVLAALYGGLQGGLMATVLSSVLVNYFWMGPTRTLRIRNAGDALAVAAFCLSGILISAVVKAMHQAQARAAAAEKEARHAAELRRAEEQVRNTLESIGDGFFALDRDWRFVYVNSPAERILDIRRQDVLGKSHWDVFPLTLGTDLEGEYRRTAGGEIRDFENFFEPWGRWFHNRCFPREGGGMSVFFQDITKRKQSEQAVRESEEKYRNLFENMAEEVHFWRLIRDDDGRIKTWRLVDANPPTLKTWRRTSVEEIRGRTADEILGPGTTEHYMPIVQKIMDEGVPCSYEDYFPNLDRYFRFSSVPLGEYFITTGADITAIKKVQEALRQAVEELKRSNRDLEQFAYFASHDLQEPLRQVMGFGDLLRQRYADKIDEKGQQYMGFMVEGARRMSALVRALLDYSRVGRRERTAEPASADEAADIALTNLRVSVEESTAKVTRDPLPMVLAEPTELSLIFQNLIGNALKFRREGVTPEVHIGCKSDGRISTFWVKDNGIGIPPDQYDRAFIVFQRLHGQGRYPGTGIGLAICRKIVEQHGGRIWIESEVGKGSTFFFTLPSAKEARA